MELKDTVALITGGGSGLGEATALEFVAGGGKAVILDLPNSAGPALADSFGAHGLFVAADVGSGEAVEKAIATGIGSFRRPAHCRQLRWHRQGPAHRE